MSCHPFPLKLLPTCERIGLSPYSRPLRLLPHLHAPNTPHPKVARNSPRTSFIGSSKPRNINDLISNPETSSRELRAKLLSCTRFLGRPARRPPRGLRGLAGLRDDAPGHTSATQRRRCGGRRRDRRARSGFEIDHSEPLGSRVAISRAAGPSGARNTSGATSNNTQHGRLAARTSRGRAAVHGTARPHNAAARPQPENATKSSPSEPCARAGASLPGRSGCGPRCAAPRLRCR